MHRALGQTTADDICCKVINKLFLCQNERPRTFSYNILDSFLNVTLKWYLFVDDLPHNHSKRVDVHQLVRILSLLLLAEAFRRRVYRDRAICIEHVCIPLEITHLHLSQLDFWIVKALRVVYKHIVWVETTVGHRRCECMELVHNLRKLDKKSKFSLE